MTSEGNFLQDVFTKLCANVPSKLYKDLGLRQSACMRHQHELSQINEPQLTLSLVYSNYFLYVN